MLTLPALEVHRLLLRGRRLHASFSNVLFNFCRGYVLFLTYKTVLMEKGGSEDVWKVSG
jgi:hypothetical protein